MVKEKHEMFYTHVLIPAILLQWLARPKAFRDSLRKNNFTLPKYFRVTAVFQDSKRNYFLSIHSETIYGNSIFKITSWNPFDSAKEKIEQLESGSTNCEGQLFRLPERVRHDPLEVGNLMVDTDEAFLLLGWKGEISKNIVAEITELGLKERK